jgi:hypothetical protein
MRVSPGVVMSDSMQEATAPRLSAVEVRGLAVRILLLFSTAPSCRKGG